MLKRSLPRSYPCALIATLSFQRKVEIPKQNLRLSGGYPQTFSLGVAGWLHSCAHTLLFPRILNKFKLQRQKL